MSSTPNASSTELPGDDAVHWFGASRRLIGGVPDSRYGWLDHAEGPCVVKAMDPALVAYNKTLLNHERRMLQRLADIGAPVPAAVDVGRSDWLVTRFAGLSLQRLEHPGGIQGLAARQWFSAAERLSAWVHLLRRLQPLADAGVLAIDLYPANVLLPLTGGTAGQLRLNEAVLIDHAHTLEAGMDLRRPVWLDRDSAYIAPELRHALMQDQEALIGHFRQAGAALPGYSRLPGERDELSRRAWAEYSAPQAVQRLLDAGELSRDQAMQFAAATALADSVLPVAGEALRTVLGPVLARMRAEDPAWRYSTLTEAAQAVAQCVDALPLVSAQRFAPLKPSDLARPDGIEAPLKGGGPSTGLAGSLDGTALTDGVDATPLVMSAPGAPMAGSEGPASEVPDPMGLPILFEPLAKAAFTWPTWGMWAAGLAAAVVAWWP